jgi:hypothetical protein
VYREQRHESSALILLPTLDFACGASGADKRRQRVERLGALDERMLFGSLATLRLL